MLSVKFITPDNDAFRDVKKLRTDVFVNEQGAIANDEFDEFDEYGAPSTFAVIYNEDSQLSATGRLIIVDNQYKIGRIAVSQECRGKGYGSVIVRTLLLKSFSMGAQNVVVDAQNHAVSFYKKIGFKINGDELIDRGLKHIPMIIDHTSLCKCGGTNG